MNKTVQRLVVAGVLLFLLLGYVGVKNDAQRVADRLDNRLDNRLESVFEVER